MVSDHFRTKTFSAEQIPETGSPDANLILPQYKVDVMFRFLEKKSSKSNLTQKQVAKN